MIVVDLIYNLAVLVSVSVIAGFVDKRWQRSTSSGRIIQGALFGMVAVLSMMNPFIISDGVIFDGRSVILSLCAMFFGPVSAAIAAVMALLMRLHIGGAGTIMGVSTILSSTFIGIAFFFYRKKHTLNMNALHLWLFGMLVHTVMVIFIFTLPNELRLISFHTLAVTILGVYPVATVLTGKILMDQEENYDLLDALKHSKDQYRSLIQEMQQGLAVFEIVYTDDGKVEDYRFILINPNYEKLTGLSEKEILGRTIQEVFPRTEEFWNERFEKVALSGVPEYYENFSLELDRYYEVVVYSPRKHQLAVILTDITERKGVEARLLAAKEQAEAGDRLKTAFMNNISHEIRTPLNGILGFGQLISQPEINDSTRQQYMGLLQNSVERLIQTVNDYMDVSLIASGNLKVNYTWFALDEFTLELQNNIKKAASDKNLELFIELPERDLQLFSDRELLIRACDHLLNNAVKFTRYGSVKFGFDTFGEEIRFFVEDTGVGIAKESLNRIFEAFDQEENTKTRSYEGSGLGLAIAKGIVKRLGGKIGVNSEKDKGSLFFFHLPKLTRKNTNGMDVHGSPTEIINHRPVILIAEDDDSSYVYLCSLLQKSEVDLIRARDGMEAVQVFRDNPMIDLVLMDIKMPLLDGKEAVKMIKAVKKKPVIAITAYALSGDESSILEAGFDAYIAKPYKSEALKKNLEQFGLIL
jgi:PAS domain S-box-containing protein